MSKESEERKQEIEKICVEADEEKATLSKKLKSLSLKCSRKDKVIEVREYLWKRWDQGLIRGLAETRLVAPLASITVLQSWKCYDLYKTLLLYFSEWKGSSRWLAENCWGESWERINVRYWPCQRRGKEGLCSSAVISGSMGAQCVWDYFWHLVFFFLLFGSSNKTFLPFYLRVFLIFLSFTRMKKLSRMNWRSELTHIIYDAWRWISHVFHLFILVIRNDEVTKLSDMQDCFLT